MIEITQREHYEISRRQTLKQMGAGFGGAMLASLLHEETQAGTKIHDLKPRMPMHEPRAKAVIQLFMHGGPSQVDLLDPKPLLNKHSGETPVSYTHLRAHETREDRGIRRQR